MTKLLIFSSLIFLLSGCSSIQSLTGGKTNNLELPELEPGQKVIDGRAKTRIELLTTAPTKVKVPQKLSKAIVLKEEERIPTPTVAISKESEQFNLKYPDKLYKFWMKYYKTRDRKRFQRQMNRGHRVEKIVKATLRKHHLPEELFYVGLIESGYSERISSSANAVGPWQFIKGTATRYGLRVDRYVDERFNIVKASEASAQYFKDLYNIFGSWELALCAYNAGEYRIINAIRRGNTRDYRELVKKKLLPKETIYYVPKVMAAKKIYENKSYYGYANPRSNWNPFEGTVASKFTSSFSLKKVAKRLGLSYKDLKNMNPDVKTGWVHIKRGRNYKLLVPRKSEVKAHNLAKTYKEKRSRPVARKLAKLESKIKAKLAAYRVQKGDNLSRIARMFNTNIRKIKRTNRLKSTRVYIGQKLRIPNLFARTYVVKRGDNLGVIARRFRTSIASIRGLNNLRTSRIYPKQKIQIPVKS